MPRFKITVQYDGTGFRGWQLQKSDRTVQGELESALKTFNKTHQDFFFSQFVLIFVKKISSSY